jgi:hypothetical protein
MMAVVEEAANGRRRNKEEKERGAAMGKRSG